jgi:hypothetical protein
MCILMVLIVICYALKIFIPVGIGISLRAFYNNDFNKLTI